MNKVFFVLILIITTLFIFGCVFQDDKDNLVGEWYATGTSFPDEFGQSQIKEYYLIFNKNGTGVMEFQGFPEDFNYQIIDKNSIKIIITRFVSDPKWQTIQYSLVDNNTLVFSNYRLTRKS